jgi:hypothetical protein
MLGYQADPMVIVALIDGAFAVIGTAAMILHARHRTRVAGGILANWAYENSYQFIAIRKKWILVGPFRWRTCCAVVFRGIVLTPDGQQRPAYFRVGGWFLGLWSDQVTVEWED